MPIGNTVYLPIPPTLDDVSIHIYLDSVRPISSAAPIISRAKLPLYPTYNKHINVVRQIKLCYEYNASCTLLGNKKDYVLIKIVTNKHIHKTYIEFDFFKYVNIIYNSSVDLVSSLTDLKHVI